MRKFLLALLVFFVFSQQSLFAGTLTSTDSLVSDTTYSSTLSNSVTIGSGSVLSVSGVLNFSPDPSSVSAFSSRFDDGDGFNPEQVLRVEAGAKLAIGDVETGDFGALVISENTLLIIEQGSFLQIADGSSLIIEYGGGIIIESGVDLDLGGEQAMMINSCFTCLPPDLGMPIDPRPPLNCPPTSIICDIGRPIEPSEPLDPPPPAPHPVVDSYASTVAGNDLEYINTLFGFVGTTPSGALTYTIPIQVPVGTSGMQPQLAIVYNSQNNFNGVLGLGFSISGLSSISRVGRNFYHDN
ncbi:MAG: hypothetical protein FWC98_05085, partial [Bacteroidales bacterium]|nr:hypothetical protein [Bacteroidales bacterium]